MQSNAASFSKQEQTDFLSCSHNCNFWSKQVLMELLQSKWHP